MGKEIPVRLFKRHLKTAARVCAYALFYFFAFSYLIYLCSQSAICCIFFTAGIVFVFYKRRYEIWFRWRAKKLGKNYNFIVKGMLAVHYRDCGLNFIYYPEDGNCYVGSDIYTIPPFVGTNCFNEYMKCLRERLKEISPIISLEVNILSYLSRSYDVCVPKRVASGKNLKQISLLLTELKEKLPKEENVYFRTNICGADCYGEISEYSYGLTRAVVVKPGGEGIAIRIENTTDEYLDWKTAEPELYLLLQYDMDDVTQDMPVTRNEFEEAWELYDSRL